MTSLFVFILFTNSATLLGFGPGPLRQCISIEKNVKTHVQLAGLITIQADNASHCCTLCSMSFTSSSPCATWCYGWPATANCHMSPHPPLNHSNVQGYSSGQVALPPRPPPPPLPPPPLQPPALGFKPHIVVFLVDDLGYGNVGYTRAEHHASAAEVRTPHIDALVKSGIELKRNYV